MSATKSSFNLYIEAKAIETDFNNATTTKGPTQRVINTAILNGEKLKLNNLHRHMTVKMQAWEKYTLGIPNTLNRQMQKLESKIKEYNEDYDKNELRQTQDLRTEVIDFLSYRSSVQAKNALPRRSYPSNTTFHL